MFIQRYNLQILKVPVYSIASGKRKKEEKSSNYCLSQNLILSIHYVHSDNLQTESVPVHSIASGERGKIVIVMNQTVSYHTNSILTEYKHIQDSTWLWKTCSFKGNLRTETVPVHSTAEWGKEQKCDHSLSATYFTEFNPENAPHKGNLKAGNVPVHSNSSWVKEEKLWYEPNYHSLCVHAQTRSFRFKGNLHAETISSQYSTCGKEEKCDHF